MRDWGRCIPRRACVVSGGAPRSLRALFRSPEKREKKNKIKKKYIYIYNKPFPQAIIEQHSFFPVSSIIGEQIELSAVEHLLDCTTLFNQFEFAFRLHTEPIKLNQTNPTKTELSQTNAIDFL